MNEMLSMLGEFNVNYVKGQMVLLPVFLGYAALRRKGLQTTHLYWVHSTFLVLSFLLPFLFYLKLLRVDAEGFEEFPGFLVVEAFESIPFNDDDDKFLLHQEKQVHR